MDALSAAAALLPGLRAEPAGKLSEPGRSEVLRIGVSGRDWAGPGSLIVKLYPEAGESWARESAALAVMPDAAPAPRLIASSADPAVIVMTDAGDGPSLATALLAAARPGLPPAGRTTPAGPTKPAGHITPTVPSGPITPAGPGAPDRGSAAAATAALDQFTGALAALHVSTQAVGESFAAELAARSGGAVPPAMITALVGDSVPVLERYCGQLGVTIPPGALAELAGLPARLASSGPSALTLADACPDNNVLTSDGCIMIDFEDGEWRPVAWDLAYLTVPWPSCWCCFLLPGDVTRRALARYRAAAARELPYVGTPAFGDDLALATAGFAMVSSSWFLGAALGEEVPRSGEIEGLPTRRAVIQHRLATVQHTGALPALAGLAAGLRAELVRLWGEPPLRVAPAYRPAPAG